MGLLLSSKRAHMLRKAPSTTFLPKLLFWLFSSYSSLHFGQKKSAAGQLFSNWLMVEFPQLGQKTHVRVHCSVHALALCGPLT